MRILDLIDRWDDLLDLANQSLQSIAHEDFVYSEILFVLGESILGDGPDASLRGLR